MAGPLRVKNETVYTCFKTHEISPVSAIRGTGSEVPSPLQSTLPGAAQWQNAVAGHTGEQTARRAAIPGRGFFALGHIELAVSGHARCCLNEEGGLPEPCFC